MIAWTDLAKLLGVSKIHKLEENERFQLDRTQTESRQEWLKLLISNNFHYLKRLNKIAESHK